MRHQDNRAHWDEIEREPCEHCGAQPGSPCMIPNGRSCYPHAQRMDNWREAHGHPRRASQRGTATSYHG